MDKSPKVSLDILVMKDNRILLGLLSKKWFYKGKQVYGVPGRELFFGESIGDSVRRNIKEELDIEIVSHKIISINANRALGNHFIGIGVLVETTGDEKLLTPNDWEKWEWFDLKEIPQNLFPPAKYLIQSYIENKICVSE